MNLPKNPSESMRKRNPRLWSGPPNQKPTCDFQPALAVAIAKSCQEDGLNKTERRYWEWLQRMGDDWVGVQCLTFKLGHDCRFTPDFIAVDKTGLRAVDVKAFFKSQGKVHVEDDALVKLRVAARMFPWCRFLIAFERDGIWRHTEIKT